MLFCPRKSLFIITGFLLLLCCQEKEYHANSAEQILQLKKNLTSYPGLEQADSIITLSEKKHIFSNGIHFKGAYAVRKKNNAFLFFWVFDESMTDFESLGDWKLGMILKPRDRQDFKSPVLKKKGIKTQGVNTRLYLHNNQIVMLLDNFTLIPRKFSYIKFYMYGYDSRMDLDYWIIKDINLETS